MQGKKVQCVTKQNMEGAQNSRLESQLELAIVIKLYVVQTREEFEYSRTELNIVLLSMDKVMKNFQTLKEKMNHYGKNEHPFCR